VSYQHKELAAGRWSQMLFIDQMANIGSEVERALDWRARHNELYCQQALERALELIDLTLDRVKGFCRLREIARIREALVDYFMGTNQFGFIDESLRKYFFNFIFASRKDK
jgi:hypothetical protein